MAVRSGMAELIAELRLMTDTATGSDTVNGVEYWTDQQLQDALDMHSVRHTRVQLQPEPELAVAGVYSIRTYAIPKSVGKWLERDSVDNNFVVQAIDGTPVLVGDGDNDYQPDYNRRLIVFNTPTNRRTYYLTAYSYDLNKTAADIWLKKAGLRAALVQWKTDNHTIYEDQEYMHCMDKYREYASRGGGGLAKLIRVDEAYYRGY